MLNGIETTVVGNLTNDPNLVYTSSGDAVCNFSIAINPRTRTEKGEWEQKEAQFVRCTVWRDIAENVGESLGKGDRVIVTGQLRLNTYETSDGEQRSNLEMNVAEVGVSLRFHMATPKRMVRENHQEEEQEPPKRNGKPGTVRKLAKSSRN